jgi:hypothetical protein
VGYNAEGACVEVDPFALSSAAEPGADGNGKETDAQTITAAAQSFSVLPATVVGIDEAE